MRALAAVVALALSVALAAPHVHAHATAHPGAQCLACAVRQGEPARSEAPDVAPTLVRAEDVEAPPPRSLPVGAPLGAIPGQSPPAGA